MKIHIKICASGLEKKTGVQSITMKVSSLISWKKEKQVSRRKDIIKLKAEIKWRKIDKQYQKINKVKVGSWQRLIREINLYQDWSEKKKECQCKE